MMKKTLTLITIAMLAIMAFSIVPTFAWVTTPPNQSNPATNVYTDNGNYELFGPHIANLHIYIYSDEVTEWTAMSKPYDSIAGTASVDVTDEPITKNFVDSWAVNQSGITEANYGGEAGYYILDVNNNVTFADDTLNPTSVLALRQAIAYCVNRSYIISNLLQGLGDAIYTPIPAYMSTYINENITPGNPTYGYLTYGGYTGNVASAATLLNAVTTSNGHTDSFPIGLDGYRHWIYDGVDRGDLVLTFYSRNDLPRWYFGNYLDLVLTSSPIDIKVTYVANQARSALTSIVFANTGDWNMYTGAWISIGPNPDYLCDLYNGSNYYYPGSPENYAHVETPDTDGNLTALKLAPTIAAGNASCQLAQIAIAEDCGVIPLWSNTGIKAYSDSAIDEPSEGNWTDMVNQLGIGVSSWYSFQDMYPNLDTSTYTTGTAEFGFSSTMSLENPVYSQWYWDWEVLGEIYDSGAARDPYTLQTWVPQLFENWTQGIWTDPTTHQNKTSVTITLRPDVYWQDGQPLTIADVYYTLVTMSNAIIAKGLPPPWWYPTVALMRSVEIIDAYHITILLDTSAVWAVGWVIGSTILPMHIWQPIVAAAGNGVTGFSPDSKLIGTGPFRLYSVTGDVTAPGAGISLIANTRGSVAMGVTSPYGYYNYYPIWVDIQPMDSDNKINVYAGGRTPGWGPTNYYPSISESFSIMSRNLYILGPISVNQSITVAFKNGTVVDSKTNLDVSVPAGVAWNTTNVYDSSSLAGANQYIETPPVNLTTGNLYYVTVDEQINTAPWAGVWINVTIPVWVTIAEDIGISNLYADMGYSQGTIPSATFSLMQTYLTTPDLKVDGKDVSTAARAFGTKPGDPRWNPVCDVAPIGAPDFKIDGKDISTIAKFFGVPA